MAVNRTARSQATSKIGRVGPSAKPAKVSAATSMKTAAVLDMFWYSSMRLRGSRVKHARGAGYVSGMIFKVFVRVRTGAFIISSSSLGRNKTVC